MLLYIIALQPRSCRFESASSHCVCDREQVANP